MYRLRELERADIVFINRWRNDPELIHWLCTPFRYINLDVDEAWYNTYMEKRNCAVRCAIIREKDSSLVGCVYLLNIDWTSRCADFGIMIGEKINQGQGAGTFATRGILDHAFFNLGLHRVQLEALVDNERAIRLYERNGFQREGILRDSLFKNGHYVNTVLMAVLREDYFQLRGAQV